MRLATPRRLGLTHVDVLVGLVCLLLLSTLATAQLSRAQEVANRIKCASNLKMIGQALLLYSNEDRGRYPRTPASPPMKAGEMAPPVWGTPYEGTKGLVPPQDPKFVANPFVLDKPPKEEDKALIPYRPEKNDVTAALFLLLRTQDITSEAFVCPTTELDKFDFGGGQRNALHWTNWPGQEGLRKHLSYSYQNPYPSATAIGEGFRLNNAISAEFVVAGDMNPGGNGLLKLTPKSAQRQMRDGNSFNHNRDGQNFLFGDGHVEFLQTPFAGVKQDNVYTFGKSGNGVPDKGGDGIVGSPVGPDDSIVLPTARDIEQVDEQGQFVGAPNWAAPTAREAEALRDRMIGQYEVTHADGTVITLNVSKEQMSANAGPLTITFDYTIGGVNGPNVRLALRAPQTKGESARIKFEPNGDLTISKNQYFEGQWKRKE